VMASPVFSSADVMEDLALSLQADHIFYRLTPRGPSNTDCEACSWSDSSGRRTLLLSGCFAPSGDRHGHSYHSHTTRDSLRDPYNIEESGRRITLKAAHLVVHYTSKCARRVLSHSATAARQ
jgi:hypothetical protein